MERLGRFARGALVGAAALVVALALAEVGARVWAPVALTEIARDRVRLSEDPELLYELDLAHPEHVAPGLRRGAPPGVKRGSRVLVLGDSLAYGLGVELDQTLSARLESLLPGCEVLNAGVPGWSIVQEARQAERLVPALDPDAVLLVVCHNDWTAYTVEFDALVAKADPADRGLLSRLYDPANSGLMRILWRSHLWRRLQLWSLRRTRAGLPESWTRTTEREGETLVESTSVKDHFAGRAFFARYFERLARTLARRRVPLIVALVPIGDPRYDELHRRRLEELGPLCRSAGALLVDLREGAATAGGSGRPWYAGLYHEDDALHPSAEGWRVFARVLAAPLRSVLP